MPLRKLRFFLYPMLISLLGSISACAGSVDFPVEEEVGIETTAIAVIATTPTLLSTRPPQPTALPGVPEARQLTLELPAKIRVGDADLICLTLELNEDSNLMPTAQIAGYDIYSEPVEIPNLYATHNVMAEARLDIAGVQAVPLGEISEPLRPDLPTTFFWSIRTDAVGTYRGSIWLHFRFIPIDGGAESRRLLSNQLVEIEAVNILGLGGTPARILGGVGVVIGSFLALDNVFSWLWDLLQKLLASRVDE